MSNWLILRVYAGLPLHVERTLREQGVDAYCPVRTIHRPHPRGKEVIVQRKPMLPGYLFSHQHFETDRINTTRTKARWLMFGGRLATITEQGIAALRESEGIFRPDLHDLAHVLDEIAKGVPPKKHRYINLGDAQTLAKQGQYVISPA